MGSFNSLEFQDEQLRILNQTLLPFEKEYIVTDDYKRIADAIKLLEVRGAPAIGIAAAYAVALAFKNSEYDLKKFEEVSSYLASTRPTAVNLFGALSRMEQVFLNHNSKKNIYEYLLAEARKIHNEDIKMCEAMGENGLEIFSKKSVVLTHCNTGALATGGSGTAFAVIRKAYEEGLIEFVYADETRPLLQGSRLTAFELEEAGIPFAISVDSAAAHIIKGKGIDLIITGADRIAANGDSANKIGTYSLAVLANYHKIPFYIVAPSSTIDKNCKSGKEIVIEERGKEEVTEIKGVSITKNSYNVYSPAFDVTPAELITGIITEEKLFKFPFGF